MQDKETLYARWISGDIDADELEFLRKEGVIDDLNQIVNTTDQWAMPKFDTASAYAKYKNRYPQQKPKLVQLNWKWLASVAAMLVVAISVWTLYLNNQETRISAEDGRNELVSLDDGTQIIVNDGSTVNYQLKDWATLRRVNLTGEAYFDVESGIAFDVMTGNGTVKVLGTQFNVRAWGKNLYVECYEGRVQIEANGQEVVLEQSQSINVVEGAMRDKQSITNVSPLWRDNSSRFFEEQANVVFTEIERQFDVTVNAPLINRNFSGIFKHDTLDNALHRICKPLGLSYTISKDTKEVLIKK